VFTRYSANDAQFPVNDRSLFNGKSHAIGGVSRPNGPAGYAIGKLTTAAIRRGPDREVALRVVPFDNILDDRGFGCLCGLCIRAKTPLITIDAQTMRKPRAVNL